MFKYRNSGFTKLRSILLCIVVILLIVYIGIYYKSILIIYETFIGLRNSDKFTLIIALSNIVLVGITLFSLAYARKSNYRAEITHISENCPLIDVSPISVMQDYDIKQVKTFFSIANYSGFSAYRIGIDLKYGNNSWILEWRKARKERDEKGNKSSVIGNKEYFTTPDIRIDKLKPGETINRDSTGSELCIVGSLNLERDVCSKGNDGLPVWVRVSWQNSNRHTFDEVRKYRLICTIDSDKTEENRGRAFNFIPEDQCKC